MILPFKNQRNEICEIVEALKYIIVAHANDIKGKLALSKTRLVEIADYSKDLFIILDK